MKRGQERRRIDKKTKEKIGRRDQVGKRRKRIGVEEEKQEEKRKKGEEE